MTQFSQVPVENGIANKTKRTTALEKREIGRATGLKNGQEN